MRVPELDAEECAQDVLFKVHLKVATFKNDGRSKLTTWIFEIAKNCAIDFIRLTRKKRQEIKGTDVPLKWHGQFAGRNTAWLAWLGEELQKFSAEDQQILLLRAQDIPYAEIGVRLGINEGTVRVRHLRAKRRLLVADNQPATPGNSTGRNIPESGVVHE
jgi:RNA polymerase sigma factor (sigma-70 family)